MFHIVEDDKTLAQLLGDLVGVLGYQSQIYTDPEAYLHDTMQEGFIPPKATLTDLIMPRLKGDQLIKKVHQQHPKMRFIMISGTPQIQLNHHVACMYLHKPYDISVLEESLQKVCRCIDGELATDLQCNQHDHRSCFKKTHCYCPHI